MLPRPVVCALLALAVLAVAGCGGPAPLDETVRVEQGELRGLLDGDVLRFGDVPYAAPTPRWVPPRPPEPWSGVRDATGPGSRCPQTAAAPGVPHATAASADEDCLTLDVTVPAGTTAGARLPVLVWLHGGGFSAGAGADYDPRRLARAGLVVVTVNYRLGPLGFLALPELSGSGAFGIQDQQAALVWVARNAAAFGGDPELVTLAGESAGADGVCAQLASPAAGGLFARAVMQSGGCGTANVVDVIGPGTGPVGDTWKALPVAEDMGEATADALGCDDGRRDDGRRDDGRRDDDRLACLRALPVERLVGVPGYWSPAVGTPTLPRRPSDVLAQAPPVPVLAGTVRDEGVLFTHAFLPTLDASTFRTLLARAAGDRAREVGRAYAPGDRSPSRAWADVVTDRAYACPALATYDRLAGRGPVFAYEFADTRAPSPFAAPAPDLADGVVHGAEVPYLFDLRPGPPLTAAQQGTATDLVAAWARFARTGDPGWPAWGAGGPVRTITAGATSDVPAAEFAAAHHCDLWTGAP
ncbi:carboxylesterase/lipase family protein [Pseudonocardia broussonetiae]|uniref:Carboxylic ester hydrolase n=1 Tax=Pseudonocardia broussonetiae TaxID=2736640 RepID=A0A6M6JMV8_9PSEU|nr:carboxylesterase family protein [Pseudonocardia broussonetiae]QJY48420.1 carboxylesterase family protein [Pseudonocardia broussonetiae]